MDKGSQSLFILQKLSTRFISISKLGYNRIWANRNDLLAINFVVDLHSGCDANDERFV
jgi:hypothetical protein